MRPLGLKTTADLAAIAVEDPRLEIRLACCEEIARRVFLDENVICLDAVSDLYLCMRKLSWIVEIQGVGLDVLYRCALTETNRNGLLEVCDGLVRHLTSMSQIVSLRDKAAALRSMLRDTTVPMLIDALVRCQESSVA